MMRRLERRTSSGAATGFARLAAACWLVLCVSLGGLFIHRAAPKPPQSPTVSVASSGARQAQRPPAYRTKNIEDLKSGEKVWAYDVLTGAWAAREVLRPIAHEYEGVLVSVSVGGQAIEATDEHPFWVIRGEGLAERPAVEHVPNDEQAEAIRSGNGRWVAARDLRVGDMLVLRSGEVPVESVSSRSATLTVYNLEVADLHTYAVGGQGVVVHNNGGSAPKRIQIDASRSPDAAKHLVDTGVTGRPLPVNRPGAPQNRADATRGKPKVPGHDLDESPPAVLRQSGDPVSVRPIPSGDNRSAGGQLGRQLNGVKDGEEVIIDVVNPPK
jgi:hypothetical protein